MARFRFSLCPLILAAACAPFEESVSVDEQAARGVVDLSAFDGLTLIEAEHADLVGPVEVSRRHLRMSNGAFADYVSETEGAVEITFDVTTRQLYHFSFRYSLAAPPRHMDLDVRSASSSVSVSTQELTFERTYPHGWLSWGKHDAEPVLLEVGRYVMSLQVRTNSGPNLDIIAYTTSEAPEVPIGCADGSREAFVDTNIFGEIAGCSGAWSIPGIAEGKAVEPACGRQSGNDGENRYGHGCNVTDLCSQGWHVCSSADEVHDKANNYGCEGAILDGSPEPRFFATRQSGWGEGHCSAGTNDLFGCGNVGGTPSSDCGVLNAFSHDLCAALPPDGWRCGFNPYEEARNVQKPINLFGGVLCCAD